MAPKIRDKRSRLPPKPPSALSFLDPLFDDGTGFLAHVNMQSTYRVSPIGLGFATSHSGLHIVISQL